MIFRKISARTWSSSNWYLLSYLVLLLCELLIIHKISDISPETSNWVPKSLDILNFNFPSNNYYGPGGAILMLPFAIIEGTTYWANVFYFMCGSVAFWQLSRKIQSIGIRAIVLSALPLNVYLVWLINSSQDTVFEFCLLMWSLYMLLQHRFKWFCFFGFLLCETRSAYWVWFLCVSLISFISSYKKSKKASFGKLSPFVLLAVMSVVNSVNYGSASPALEGGITAYFSYTKYNYLAHPKMDLDVFLSGPKGPFAKNFGPIIPSDSSLLESNEIYAKAAIDSALSNPKETILGWMQKLDSYYFVAQKVPNLPGSYELDLEANVIRIGQERLTWYLVLGNLIQELYRALLLCLGLIALGLFLGSRKYLKSTEQVRPTLAFVCLPFLVGILPALLFFTETRYKIVSELALVLLVGEVWSIMKNYKSRTI